MTERERVVAVVVTWNRRDLLVESLAAIEAQTRPADRVIVVDNASDDGTAELLARDFGRPRHRDRTRATPAVPAASPSGLERALDDGCDAVWLMDDDTVPEPTALGGAGRLAPAMPANRPRWSRRGSSGPTAATTR